MQKRDLSIILALMISLLLTPVAKAELLDRGDGMIYDTERDLTWAQDVKLAMTSGVDDDGLMDWDRATEWVNTLELGGFTDWRLPTNLDRAGMPCTGLRCDETELLDLLITQLGNDRDVGLTANAGPFINIEAQQNYWMGNEVANTPDGAYVLQLPSGSYGVAPRRLESLAWAVRDGDVLPVSPTPADFIQPSFGAFFAATASGGQEVTEPPGGVDVPGTCLATFRVLGSDDAPMLRYRVHCYGMIHITQVHIHSGTAEENGDVVAFLLPNGEPTGPVDGLIRREKEISQGVLEDFDLVGDLAGMTIADLLALMRTDRAYVNVHTIQHPMGAVRGQIGLVPKTESLSEEYYLGMLTGSQGVPPAVNTASCTASIRPINPELIKYKVRCQDIAGVTQVTLHTGTPQETGPVVATLFPDGAPTGPVSGLIERGEETSEGALGEAELTGFTVVELIERMRSGLVYVNVLTDVNPDGAARGSVVRVDTVGGGL